MAIEKLDLNTPDFANENAARIAELFPNVVTEARDETGKTRLVVDFDLLKQELSADIVEGSAERYHLNWPGKRAALREANRPIDKTLRPVREESVDFDTTRNLFIEGDNLDALKLLQETYLAKVKMIYIDPPYNTGKDFIYQDNFTGDKGEHLEASEQVDEGGGRLVANPETNGRYHSDWLSMMYPRLKLARNLLRDDGVIFLSIDDNEYSALNHLCDEVFGESNFLGAFVWKRRSGAMDAVSNISEDHEYVLCFSKSGGELNGVPRSFDRYSNPDNDPRGDWISDNLSAGKPGGDTYYPIVDPKTGNEFLPPAGRYWPYSRTTMAQKIAEGRVLFPNDADGTPMLKRFKEEAKSLSLPVSTWIQNSAKLSTQSSLVVPMNSSATRALSELLGGKIFSFPKPVELVRGFIRQSTQSDDIVLDFFAGSGATAHAVMMQNAEDSGSRAFIQVQLPEDVGEGSPAALAGYSSIAAISKERIRRAGKKILDDNPEISGQLDIGFRVLKIDSSNMADVAKSAGETEQSQIDALAENIKRDRSAEDLLFQVMLNWGVDLTLPISCEEIRDQSVYFVADDALAGYFGDAMDKELIETIAKRQPLRVVFKDGGFPDDAMRINAEQLFKQLSPRTELRVI